MQITKILTPVDGSEHSKKACLYAIEIARQFNCEILLLHCHKVFPSYLGEPHFQEVVNKTLQKANELLEPYRELVKTAGIKFTELLLQEPAGKAIADSASIENTDLIVMGSRGLSNLEGLILGSKTHKVLNMAKCPVLVVK